MAKNLWKSLLNEPPKSPQRPMPEQPLPEEPQMTNNPSQEWLPEVIERTENTFKEMIEGMKAGQVKGIALFVDVEEKEDNKFYDAKYTLNGNNFGLVGFAQTALTALAQLWLMPTQSEDKSNG
jgi:hypothetical protein